MNQSIEQTLGLETSQPSKFRLFGWFLAIGLISLFGAAIWYKYAKSNTPLYSTTTLSEGNLTISVSATGNLEPTTTVDVGIEVSGTISDVLVDYNDHVRKNQPLARLDLTKLDAAATASKANLEKARANALEAKAAMENARIEYERLNGMYRSTGGNYPSQKELLSSKTLYEQSKAKLQAADALIAQAKAQLQNDQENLRRAVVVSPINGVVLNRKVEPGQTVVAAMQTPILFTLAENLTKMKAIVSVDEADIGEVKENQKVLFSVDAYPNKEFEGRLTQLRLNSAILNGVVTYEAVVEIDNSNLLLRPGMTANVSIITGSVSNVVLVPNAALRYAPPQKEKDSNTDTHSSQEKSIWILKNGKPVQVPITIGRTDGIMSEVIDANISRSDDIILSQKKQK